MTILTLTTLTLLKNVAKIWQFDLLLLNLSQNNTMTRN